MLQLLEVNLRNPLCTGEEALKRCIHPDFETHGADVTISPKQGYQWPHKKDSCPPKNLKNKNKLLERHAATTKVQRAMYLQTN